MERRRAAEDDWRAGAACLDSDPELFFPRGESSLPDKQQIEEAKVVCRGCGVREQCLDWALDTRQEHGVWGGLSDRERQVIVDRGKSAKALAKTSLSNY